MDPWIYIILLGLLLLVASRFLPKQEASSSVVLQQVEGTLDALAAEMEEDSRELLEVITRMKSEHEKEASRLGERIAALEKQSYDLSQDLKRLMVDGARRQEEQRKQVVVQEKTESASSPEAGAARMATMKDRYGELFDMYTQGKSIEYIAKKLGMNKGEVTLILQLAKQEEAGGV
jgi:DNA-binding NarL/FixJ family response regulator